MTKKEAQEILQRISDLRETLKDPTLSPADKTSIHNEITICFLYFYDGDF